MLNAFEEEYRDALLDLEKKNSLVERLDSEMHRKDRDYALERFMRAKESVDRMKEQQFEDIRKTVDETFQPSPPINDLQNRLWKVQEELRDAYLKQSDLREEAKRIQQEAHWNVHLRQKYQRIIIPTLRAKKKQIKKEMKNGAS